MAKNIFRLFIKRRLWCFLFLCFSFPGFSTPGPGATYEEILLGEKKDTYLVKIRHFSQPGTYYSYTESFAYEVRSKDDNRVMLYCFISEINYSISPDTGKKQAHVVKENKNIPIHPEEWKPIQKRPDSGVRFIVANKQICVGVRDAKTNRYSDYYPTGMMIMGAFNANESIRVYKSGDCYYLISGSTGGWDGFGTVSVMAVPVEAVETAQKAGSYQMADLLSRLSRAQAADRRQDLGRYPVNYFFPIGWSKDGKLAYMQVAHSVESGKKGSGPYSWYFSRVVRDTVNDKMVIQEGASLADPVGRAVNSEGLKGLYNITLGVFTETSEKNIVFYQNGIQPDSSPQRLLSPGDLGLEIRILTEADSHGVIENYSVSAAGFRGTKALYQSGPDSWNREQNSLQKISLVGCIRSPYEKRIVLVLALHRKTNKTEYEWIEFQLIGCHLEAGFR